MLLASAPLAKTPSISARKVFYPDRAMPRTDPAPQPPLSPDEIRQVARLARLEPDETSLERIGRELGGILDHIRTLQTLELDAVEPLTHVGDTENRWDEEDAPAQTLAREAFMKMAPQAKDPFLRVPRVLGDASGA